MAVEERQHAGDDVARAEAVHRVRLREVGDERAVVEQHALRQPGRAAGVGEDREVARIERDVGRFAGAGERVERQHPGATGEVGGRMGRLEQRRRRDDEPRTGVA